MEGAFGRGLASVEAGREEVDLAEVERNPGHRLPAAVERHVLQEQQQMSRHKLQMGLLIPDNSLLRF